MRRFGKREKKEMAGRPAGSRNKAKVRGEENGMDRYVTGGASPPDIWKAGFDRLIKEIAELKMEVREEIKGIKEKMDEERRAREEERKKEKEEWAREKVKLEERIARLEWINEKKERIDRRNNIVIRGVNWRAEKLEREVEGFVKDSLKMDIEVKKADKITAGKGKQMVIAEVGCWEQKRIIMEKKRELAKGVIIENDLTRKERQIQQELREIAKEEREKGEEKVKVGYKKILIGEKMFWWNEKEGKLEEQRRGRRI